MNGRSDGAALSLGLSGHCNSIDGQGRIVCFSMDVGASHVGWRGRDTTRGGCFSVDVREACLYENG